MYVVDFHHDKMHHQKRHELFKENRQFKIKQMGFSYQTKQTPPLLIQSDYNTMDEKPF